jgi:hypothetical protein
MSVSTGIPIQKQAKKNQRGGAARRDRRSKHSPARVGELPPRSSSGAGQARLLRHCCHGHHQANRSATEN